MESNEKNNAEQRNRRKIRGECLRPWKKNSEKKEQADYRTPWRGNTGKVIEAPSKLARTTEQARNTEEQGLRRTGPTQKNNPPPRGVGRGFPSLEFQP
jgi:hypothetical protein